MADDSNDEDVRARVIKVVAATLKIDEDKVKEDSDFVEDLGADSLDQVELSMAIEEAFEIEIPDDAASNIKTIPDMIELVKKCKKQLN